jgi:hypothetical protein
LISYESLNYGKLTILKLIVNKNKVATTSTITAKPSVAIAIMIFNPDPIMRYPPNEEMKEETARNIKALEKLSADLSSICCEIYSIGDEISSLKVPMYSGMRLNASIRILDVPPSMTRSLNLTRVN